METRAFVLDADYAFRVLEERGYQVALGGTVTAERQTGPGSSVAVTLEPTGRLRLTRSYQSAPARTGIARFGKRSYQIARDQTTTLVIRTELDDMRRLPLALVEMERLAEQSVQQALGDAGAPPAG